MSDLATVRTAKLTFGVPGTQTTVAAGVTSTSNPYPMARGDFSVQLTAASTGTSGTGATVIWQGSNDTLAWIALGSATATSTQAAASGTTYGGAVLDFTGKRYANCRAVVAVTGTGVASVGMGS